MRKSRLEERALFVIKVAKLPMPECEYRFHPVRRYRFDLAWPDKMIAVELEGGVWSGGRHTSGVGFTQDCCKYNLATLMGWRVLRYTANTIPDMEHDIRKLIDIVSQVNPKICVSQQ